jgi:DNA (cytosine-5)-methyltransferase 1
MTPDNLITGSAKDGIAYYNDIDAYCCSWLSRLIAASELPGGTVDERSIADVTKQDLEGYRQCHFFAGIGGWPLALRLAGWPLGRSIWTGSCPCQPYSCAGKQKGAEDSRDLWPAFFRLVRECHPHTITGEQVAGAIGHGWLDRIQRDLEAEGYSVGHCVLGAHSVGAPHIRQRLYWIACRELGDADGARLRTRGRAVGCVGGKTWKSVPATRGKIDGLADTATSGQSGRTGAGCTDGQEAGDGCGMGNAARDDQQRDSESAMYREGEPSGGSGGIMADTSRAGLSGLPLESARNERTATERSGWTDYRLVNCRDGKSRRISAQPGDEPLAARLPRSLGPGGTREQRVELVAAKANRVGRLRGYGNAIVPQVAAEFIRTFMEVYHAT